MPYAGSARAFFPKKRLPARAGQAVDVLGVQRACAIGLVFDRVMREEAALLLHAPGLRVALVIAAPDGAATERLKAMRQPARGPTSGSLA